MRLTKDEQAAIRKTAHQYFGPECRVLLFGSRADDSRRGGDIDLFIDAPQDQDVAYDRRIAFLVDLKRRIGDRKIDVVIRASDSRPKPIFTKAEREGVEIA